VVARARLEDLVGRGLDLKRRYLFVVDGAKALRSAIDTVFGAAQPVQRCRNHKLDNGVSHLPEDQHEQAKASLRAAFKLDAKDGITKLEHYASWLEQEWPAAASSLRQGLGEMFTVNRLWLPCVLRRCLGTSNIIDKGHSSARDRMRRVKNWQSGSMALRWTAAAFRRGLEGIPLDHGSRESLDAQGRP
jgi:putative transposase